MGWTKHALMRGGIKDGNVYVFDSEYNRVDQGSQVPTP
jgi:hypothetical protein